MANPFDTFDTPDGPAKNMFDQFDGDKKAAASKKVAPAASKSSPTDGNSFLDNLLIGAGKGMTDIGLGIKQRLDEGADYLERNLGGKAINAALGMKNASDIKLETQAAVDEKRKVDAPIMATGGGKVGNIIGVAAPAALTAFIPGAQTLVGSALTGAALGAVEPTIEGESVARNAAGGAAGGVAGYGVSKLAARMLNPASASNEKLKLLRAEGVEPTIGQTMGGVANRIEQKLQSAPILGDGIVAARARAMDQFNNAAINRATEPIGIKVAGTGHAAVREAGDSLSGAYNDALDQVQHVTLDSQFASELSGLHGLAQNLVPSMRNKFNKTLDDIVLGRVSQQGSMLGETYKSIDSELGAIASKWQKSGIASETEFGDAIGQLKGLLNQNMRRSNPHVADRLASIDEGWANLVRIEAAAKAGKNAEGAFSPAQLNMAVQMADDSTRGRAVARGTALMQDLSGAGQSILGGTVPDSGTAGRLAMGGGALAAGFVSPAIPLGLAAGAGAYSRPMQSILNAIISSRPRALIPVSNAVSKYAGVAGGLGAASAIVLPNANRSNSDSLDAISRAQTVDEAISAAR